MNALFKNYLLRVTDASDSIETEVIQSLWSGYGKISRYQLTDAAIDSVVVKCISSNQATVHPRGWDTDLSHNRKVRSYEVETHWYQKWNQLCPSNCRTPKFLGSFSEEKDQWIVMEDLDKDFPLRKHQLNMDHVKVCLRWLANFHGTFLGNDPIGLWPIGTYWHLDTRPDEFELIEHEALKNKAHEIDDALNNCTYRTIVHGDAKLANFCFSEDGESLAAVDFQYVGGGCGMKDVAYFLGSCLSGQESELFEDELLGFYFGELQNAIGDASINIDFKDLENEWREMYPIACTDFVRFLLGWMPSHQKINNYNLKMVQAVLSKL